MKIFLADGQLGNQIFQYAFLKTIQQNNEKIIVVGFDDLIQVFSLNDKSLIHISNKNRWVRKIIYKIVKPFLYKISDVNLISKVSIEYEKVLENYRREATNFITTKGFLKNIFFVKLAFFQSEDFFDKSIINNFKIKNKFLEKAIKYLEPIKNNYKVFVHIRRGDYKNFKVYGKNTLLPISYYHTQIKWFIGNKKNCTFIFLSDDLEFIKKEFEYLDKKIVSKNSYEVDFAIMTLCNGAILSPSSFGWWGSYFMKEKDVVFAPKYWLGFESKEFYHSKPLAKFMKEKI